MTRSCPECGSNEIIQPIGRSIQFRCKKCGYVGTIEVDFPDESLKKMKAMEKSIRLEKKASKRMEGRV
jgi:uncharacterized Zn finger protein